jgi:hypothetical protein
MNMMLWMSVRRRLSTGAASVAESVVTGVKSASVGSDSSATSKAKAKAKRYSGAQLEVLSLYRSWLRAILSKDVGKERQRAMIRHVRSEFKTHAVSVRLLDVERVERLLSRGRKQLRAFRISTNGFALSSIESSDKEKSKED